MIVIIDSINKPKVNEKMLNEEQIRKNLSKISYSSPLTREVELVPNTVVSR